MSEVRRAIVLSLLTMLAGAGFASADPPLGLEPGTPSIVSLSALAFGPDGLLFVGDGKGGFVHAVDVGDRTPRGKNDGVQLADVEGKLAALLGTTADGIMIHDMAVNPVSQNIYLAVSSGRANWKSVWELPNDIADASVLLRIRPDGEIEEVRLAEVSFASVALPNPVDAGKAHGWKKGISLRADTITDMAFFDGQLYVAGLSNEEFASTMWRMAYPFAGAASATTLEIFHGAHGEYETQAPIRAFVPYPLNGQAHLLAAYLCTPLVTFPLGDLQAGKHLKGRTVAEFGSGNYPLDMVVVRKDGEDRLVIANSNLPFMVVDPKNIERFEGEIKEEVKGYLAGVEFEPRSGTGVLQMDRLNDEQVVALFRQPSGKLSLASLPVDRF